MEVTVIAPEKKEVITPAIIDDYLKSFGVGTTLTPQERTMFLKTATTWGLNPIKREIHVVAFGEGRYRQCSIIVGYEVYIKRADRTGKLDGWNVTYQSDVNNNINHLKAIITIWRKDWRHPFKHEVYWEEAVQRKKDGTPTGIWQKMPRFMLKKVAVGQGFRLCFPDELGGMPYAEGELSMPERNVTPDDFEPDPQFEPPPPPPPKQEYSVKQKYDVHVALKYLESKGITEADVLHLYNIGTADQLSHADFNTIIEGLKDKTIWEALKRYPEPENEDIPF